MDSARSKVRSSIRAGCEQCERDGVLVFGFGFLDHQFGGSGCGKPVDGLRESSPGRNSGCRERRPWSAPP